MLDASVMALARARQVFASKFVFFSFTVIRQKLIRWFGYQFGDKDANERADGVA